MLLHYWKLKLVVSVVLLTRYLSKLKADRGFALASSALIEAAKKRGGKSFIDKLTNELIDASNGQVLHAKT